MATNWPCVSLPCITPLHLPCLRMMSCPLYGPGNENRSTPQQQDGNDGGMAQGAWAFSLGFFYLTDSSGGQVSSALVAGVGTQCVIFVLGLNRPFRIDGVLPRGPPSWIARAWSRASGWGVLTHSSSCGGQTGLCPPLFGSPCSVAPCSRSHSGGSALGFRAFCQAPSRSRITLAQRQCLSAFTLALSRWYLGNTLAAISRLHTGPCLAPRAPTPRT